MLYLPNFFISHVTKIMSSMVRANRCHQNWAIYLNNHLPNCSHRSAGIKHDGCSVASMQALFCPCVAEKQLVRYIVM